MKAISKSLAVLTVLAFSFAAILVRAQDVPPPPPDDQGDQSDQGASFQTFYDQLGDQGTWVQTDDYGYVFQPNVTDPNWAPYTDGHWVYTDVGWTWVSDEPWGWATYHYGRWANIDGTGWVWVPGYRWAPAWVSWRYGGGYAGWAPLPPESFVGAEYGGSGGWATFHFGSDVDVSFGIGAGCYNFVRVGDMGEPNYRGRFIDRSRNYTVINNTTNITNINITNNNGTSANFQGVVAKGPRLSDVNAHSHQRISTVHLTAANQAGRSNLQGGSLAVYAPRVNPAGAKQARPARIVQTLSNPTFNRGVSITKPLAAIASLHPAAPSSEAIAAAQKAQSQAPAKARIATENTTPKTRLSQPLTSLEPVSRTRQTTSAAEPGINGSNGAKAVRSTEENSTANAPFTGEPAKLSERKQGEVAPLTTYRPVNEAKPQTEAKPATAYHPTYHPENQVKPQGEPKPDTTFRPKNESKPSTATRPAETYRPPPQPSGGSAYHPSAAPAVASHSQAPSSGGQGNKAAGKEENKKAAADKKSSGQ